MTRDSARTWISINPPPTHLNTGGDDRPDGVAEIRFADLEDGWAFGPDLWVTHDGGGHWQRLYLPSAAAPGYIQDVEAVRGTAHAAVLSGDNAVVDIESSPTGRDSWHISPTSINLGAGPVPRATVVLNASAGWIVQVDRTVIGGARLDGDTWRSWQPPCLTGGGGVTLTAASATQLAAVCNEGQWSNPPMRVGVYFSVDAGDRFSASPTQPALQEAQGSASPSPGVVVVAAATSNSTETLLATFNAGATWTTVYRSDAEGFENDLGFTNPSQGVVIISDLATPTAVMLMTFDGGHHWAPVGFG